MLYRMMIKLFVCLRPLITVACLVIAEGLGAYISDARMCIYITMCVWVFAVCVLICMCANVLVICAL
jgi:hypothetical protein